MKKLILSFALLSSFLGRVAMANTCPGNLKNIAVQVVSVFWNEYEPGNCYAATLSEVESGRYPEKGWAVFSCDVGAIHEGDVLVGDINIHWTHRDSSGKPVCDYRTFTPKN